MLLVLSGEINANEEVDDESDEEQMLQNTFNAEEPNYGMYECIDAISSYHKYSCDINVYWILL